MECLDGPLNSVATLRPSFGPDTVGDPVANPGRFGLVSGDRRQRENVHPGLTGAQLGRGEA